MHYRILSVLTLLFLFTLQTDATPMMLMHKHQRNTTLLKHKLIAYWTMDEATGATRMDSYRGQYNVADNNTVTSTATAKIGTAADFERSNSEYLDIPRSQVGELSFGDTTFQGVAWVRLESNPGSQFYTFLSIAASGDYEYQVGKDGFGQMRFNVSDGVSLTDAQHGTNLSTNTWYFVTWYHDADTNEIGISLDNGAFVTTPFSAGVYVGNSDFRIGARDGSYWDGIIDEVGVWNRRLTAAELTFLYNGGNGRTFTDF